MVATERVGRHEGRGATVACTIDGNFAVGTIATHSVNAAPVAGCGISVT
ncbi:MAG: hypothetical protein R3E08_02430 [Thiotrichaceae bacterium]